MVEWWPVRTQVGVAATADNAQVTILDEELDTPDEGLDLHGTIVSLRLWLALYDTGGASVATSSGPLNVVVLVLPPAFAVPNVRTTAELYAARENTWFQLPLPGDAAGQIRQNEVQMKTGRSFERGTRLVAVLVNDSGSALSGAAEVSITVDAYIQER